MRVFLFGLLLSLPLIPAAQASHLNGRYLVPEIAMVVEINGCTDQAGYCGTVVGWKEDLLGANRQAEMCGQRVIEPAPLTGDPANRIGDLGVPMRPRYSGLGPLGRDYSTFVMERFLKDGQRRGLIVEVVENPDPSGIIRRRIMPGPRLWAEVTEDYSPCTDGVS